MSIYSSLFKAGRHQSDFKKVACKIRSSATFAQEDVLGEAVVLYH